MRVAAKMKLIDLDSACEYKSGTSYAGAKFSSGFLPPEMVYVGDTTACVRSESLLRGGDDDDDDEEDGMGRTRHGGVGSSDGLDKFAASDRGEEKYVDPGSRPLYDVILCDSVMPNMDGPTAVRIIRELGYDGPILGVTGNTLPEQIENFVRHGADEVVSKPVKVPVLKDALSRRSGKDGVPLSARLTHSAKDGEAASAAPGGGSGGGGGGDAVTGTSTKPLHVLVVEDAPVARTMLVRLLKTMNCTIDEAEDGQQAVDKVTAALADPYLIQSLSNPISIYSTPYVIQGAGGAHGPRCALVRHDFV
jgi:CheY-like chemotaxis protein